MHVVSCEFVHPSHLNHNKNYYNSDKMVKAGTKRRISQINTVEARLRHDFSTLTNDNLLKKGHRGEKKICRPTDAPFTSQTNINHSC